MTEPTTQAGRDYLALHRADEHNHHDADVCGVRDAILAIEAEARDSEAHVTAGNNATGLREALDARRYQRLRLLGAAPYGSKQLDNSTVLRFTGLDAFVDADLATHPDRGEAHPTPLAAAPPEPRWPSATFAADWISNAAHYPTCSWERGGKTCDCGKTDALAELAALREGGERP